MNDHDMLEQELNSLGDELRTPPSIATAVLRTIASDGVDSALPESSSVVCRQRSAKQERTTAPAGRFRDRRQPRLVSAATAVAAVVVGTVLAVALLRTDTVAFAQVRQRVAALANGILYVQAVRHAAAAGGPVRTPGSPAPHLSPWRWSNAH